MTVPFSIPNPLFWPYFFFQTFTNSWTTQT